MPGSDQGVTLNRYMLIPRVLILVRREGSYLLMKGAAGKRLWANRYNGLGGHVERGEDLLAAARRELLEEAGVKAALWLCGTVMVDTGENPGIGLYVFTGDHLEGDPRASREGRAEWIPAAQVRQLPVVEDLPFLLERIRGMQDGDPPFSARSHYDENQKLIVEFNS